MNNNTTNDSIEEKNEINDVTDMPYIIYLPLEMFYEIFSWLDVNDIENLQGVSLLFYRLIKKKSFLKKIPLEDQEVKLLTPFTLRLANAKNPIALYLTAAFLFTMDRERDSFPYWIHYFEQYDAIFEFKGIIVIDAVTIQDHNKLEFDVITYIHNFTCYHIRMSFYPKIDVEEFEITEEMIGMILDRLDEKFYIYDKIAPEEYRLETCCASPRYESKASNEITISSLNIGSHLSSLRNSISSAPCEILTLEKERLEKEEKELMENSQPLIDLNFSQEEFSVQENNDWENFDPNFS